MTKEYTIDAAGKSLGRVASAAAKALLGKNETNYTPNQPPAVKVTVTNAEKLHLSEKKRSTKVYTHYSGHPGGLKEETLSQLLARRGHTEALRRAVQRMLPNNRLRVGRMKRLTITKK